MFMYCGMKKLLFESFFAYISTKYIQPHHVQAIASMFDSVYMYTFEIGSIPNQFELMKCNVLFRIDHFTFILNNYLKWSDPDCSAIKLRILE